MLRQMVVVQERQVLKEAEEQLVELVINLFDISKITRIMNTVSVSTVSDRPCSKGNCVHPCATS